MAFWQARTPEVRPPVPHLGAPAPIDQARAAADGRDRFVGFAFAGADMLAEIGPDRRVTFAAGAFREPLGLDPEHLVGRSVSTLFAPEDGAAVEISLSLLSARGKLAPMALRLANTARTQVTLSGLSLPDRAGVAWLSMARPAASLSASAALAGAPAFRQAVEGRLSSDRPAEIGLVEVGGWATLDTGRRGELEARIAGLAQACADPGALAADLSGGRFGLLGNARPDIEEMQGRLSQIVRAAGLQQPLRSAAIPLDDADVRPADAMRAMRFALSRFASSGVAGVEQAGFAGGVRGFLERTEASALGMRDALDKGAFRLAFQPIVHLQDRRIHHFEALLRPFPIAGQSFETTQDFVAFAEAMGLANRLDTAVLSRAAQALRDAKGTVIAVNASGLSLQAGSFRESLLGLIESEAVLRERLMIELTETADIDDPPGARQTISALRDAGVPVCLDDFGAGHAAFRYLHDFRVDYIKIDGAFVRNVVANPRESSFIGSMVELARSVEAQVMAEAVETEDQAQVLLEQGVTFGQGWLFGQPGALPGSR